MTVAQDPEPVDSVHSQGRGARPIWLELQAAEQHHSDSRRQRSQPKIRKNGRPLDNGVGHLSASTSVSGPTTSPPSPASTGRARRKPSTKVQATGNAEALQGLLHLQNDGRKVGLLTWHALSIPEVASGEVVVAEEKREDPGQQEDQARKQERTQRTDAGGRSRSPGPEAKAAEQEEKPKAARGVSGAEPP